MQGSENKFKNNKLIPFLKVLPRCYFFTKEAKSIRGIPDVICCINGNFVGLECKASEKSKVDELQEYHINRINLCCGYSVLIYPSNARTILENLLDFCYGVSSARSLESLLDEYFPYPKPQKATPRKKQ